MAYYRENLEKLEQISATIKYAPEHADLDSIRGFLGYVRQDLEVLASLRRPDAYTLRRMGSGMTEVTITMFLETGEAEDMVGKLWLELEPPAVSDVPPAAVPTPQEPSSTPPLPPE